MGEDLAEVLRSRKVVIKNLLKDGGEGLKVLLGMLTQGGTIGDWQEFGERKEELLALIEKFVKANTPDLDTGALIPEADVDLPLAVRNAERLGFSLGAAGEDGADPSDVREALEPVAVAVTGVLKTMWT